MRHALIPAKLKCLQQNPGSNQVHSKSFTDFSEVKIVKFLSQFPADALHMQVCNFAWFLVYSLVSGNNLIKLRHAHHVLATAQLLIFLLHPTLRVNLSILLMNLDFSYLFKLVAKLQLNQSSVEVTVDFVINMGSKHPVFNSVHPWS